MQFAHQAFGSDCTADFAEHDDEALLWQPALGQRVCLFPHQNCNVMIILEVEGVSSSFSGIETYRWLTDSQKPRCFHLVQPMFCHEFFGYHGSYYRQNTFYCNFARNYHVGMLRSLVVERHKYTLLQLSYRHFNEADKLEM
jgi:hypothetical protein